MDSRGKHIGKGMWGVFLVGIIIFSAFVFLLLKWNDAISQRQIAELQTVYPEAGAMVQDTFLYYDEKRRAILLFLGAGGLFLCSAFLFGQQLWQRVRQQRASYNFQSLLRQLVLFQRGEYCVKTDLFCEGGSQEGATVWPDIRDRLQELGYCLSMFRDRLEQEENNTKSLITNISHQLKTPFSSLKMCYELSQEDTLTAEEKQEFIWREKQEIAALEDLLEELVKLSKLESNMIQIKKQQMKLSAVITAAVNRVILKAHAKNISIQAEIPEDLAIWLDGKWTTEAIVNLVDNAIKYSPEGSKIILRVSRLPNLAFLEVEDEGIGILPEELHKIFHRFYRGKEGSAFAGEGAGVGLYLARKIIEEQDGTISAKRKSVGTVFRVTLPL